MFCLGAMGLDDARIAHHYHRLDEVLGYVVVHSVVGDHQSGTRNQMVDL